MLKRHFAKFGRRVSMQHCPSTPSQEDRELVNCLEGIIEQSFCDLITPSISQKLTAGQHHGIDRLRMRWYVPLFSGFGIN